MTRFSSICAMVAVSIVTYTFTCLLKLSPNATTCALLNEGIKLGHMSTEHKHSKNMHVRGASKPLCKVGNEEDDHVTGRWIYDKSVSTYPYRAGEDYEWGPRCTDIEKEYYALGVVPEFLKYHWQPESCDLAHFDKENLCRLMDGKRIGIMGDSMQQQFSHSFVGLMLGHFPNNFTYPTNWEAPLVVQLCPFAFPDGGKYSVELEFRRWNKYQGTDEDRRNLREVAQASDYLVLNWGVHYLPWNEMEDATKDFIALLEEEWTAPHKKPERLFWRSTIVAHDDCAASTGPSTTTGFHKNPAYNTDEIMLQDREIVKPLLQASPKLNATLLRIEKSTMMRSDGHRVVGHWGMEDCLHYCEPGPTDSWVELFYHHVVMGV